MSGPLRFILTARREVRVNESSDAIDIQTTDEVNVSAPVIHVHGGWSPRAVFLNNLFSGTSALMGTIAIAVVLWEVFVR